MLFFQPDIITINKWIYKDLKIILLIEINVGTWTSMSTPVDMELHVFLEMRLLQAFSHWTLNANHRQRETTVLKGILNLPGVVASSGKSCNGTKTCLLGPHIRNLGTAGPSHMTTCSFYLRKHHGCIRPAS